jgi:hypothetical protein
VKRSGPTPAQSASRLIDAQIRALPEWQATALTRMRKLIRQTDPDVVEEVKWRKPSNPDGVPIWSHDGIICTGEAHREHLRLTFAKGAALKDPAGVFNSGFAGKVLRAIVIHEGDTVDADAFQALVREAVELNTAAREK